MSTKLRKLVLDTNIILDWLLFADAQVESLVADIVANRALLLTHELGLDELRRVLGYSNLNLSAERQAQTLADHSAHATMIESPAGFGREHLLLPGNFPACRDPNDQFLFALAYQGKADALISKDKRVLKMSRRAARFGVRVMSVTDYNAV